MLRWSGCSSGCASRRSPPTAPMPRIAAAPRSGWRRDLEAMGFDAEPRDTPGHPVVVGHAPKPGAPHVLFYGHYDVQPVDPLDLWETPPFEPRMATLPDGRKVISARGACDDKGQVMTFVEACRAWKAVTGALPGRHHHADRGRGGIRLARTCRTSSRRTATSSRPTSRSSATPACGTRDTPAITASLRGLVYDEVIVRCADRDLHSGLFGGAARNPIHVLAQIIADLHDDNGRITLPGFYDGVEDMPPDVLEQWKKLNLTAQDFLGQVGLRIPAGEKRPHADRADPVAADLRRQRHHRRLYRRGHEDRDRRRGARQDLVPARRRAGPEERQRGLRSVRAGADPGRLLGRDHPPQGLARDPASLRHAGAEEGARQRCRGSGARKR